MIRYKNKVFNDYFIDPITAIITDKDGNVQKTYIKNGRTFWKGKQIYKIQMHTHNGYIKNMSVHHIDQNKLNDSLTNLVYLTNAEHLSIHKKGNKNFLGKTHSVESILKTSMAKWKRIYCYELDKEWDSITEMCKELNVFKSNVTKVLQGKRKQTGGYTFKLI